MVGATRAVPCTAAYLARSPRPSDASADPACTSRAPLCRTRATALPACTPAPATTTSRGRRSPPAAAEPASSVPVPVRSPPPLPFSSPLPTSPEWSSAATSLAMFSRPSQAEAARPEVSKRSTPRDASATAHGTSRGKERKRRVLRQRWCQVQNRYWCLRPGCNDSANTTQPKPAIAPWHTASSRVGSARRGLTKGSEHTSKARWNVTETGAV